MDETWNWRGLWHGLHRRKGFDVGLNSAPAANGRTGKREQAREHLTTATTMYREMDMRLWLEQAEAVTMGGA